MTNRELGMNRSMGETCSLSQHSTYYFPSLFKSGNCFIFFHSICHEYLRILPDNISRMYSILSFSIANMVQRHHHLGLPICSQILICLYPFSLIIFWICKSHHVISILKPSSCFHSMALTHLASLISQHASCPLAPAREADLLSWDLWDLP